jgi:aminoglycoside 3-N-acetyltransferase
MLVRIDEAMTGQGAPVLTRGQLVRDFRRLGVMAGQTLLVHASLRSLGWVSGGADTVVEALRQALGPGGNIVVPASTETNSLTSRKHRERIAQMTAKQVVRYYDEMPAFDRDTTKSGAGAIAETVRKSPGAFRSDHPQSSFAAVGPEAEYLMADHRLESHLGEDSPLAKLYKMDARVLMIGVGYRSCTAFHLAEYRYRPELAKQTYACVVNIAGKRQWKYYRDVVLDDREFEDIGKSLDVELALDPGRVGSADCRLMPLSNAVDFAVKWMAQYRDGRNSPVATFSSAGSSLLDAPYFLLNCPAARAGREQPRSPVGSSSASRSHALSHPGPGGRLPLRQSRPWLIPVKGINEWCL